MYCREVTVRAHAVLGFVSKINDLTFRNMNKLKLRDNWTIFQFGHYYQISVDAFKYGLCTEAP